jgi:hypothetical protein
MPRYDAESHANNFARFELDPMNRGSLELLNLIPVDSDDYIQPGRGAWRGFDCARGRPDEPAHVRTRPTIFSRTRMHYCKELRYAIAVFKSAVPKPSLK